MHLPCIVPHQVVLPNGFLAIFPARQFSQVGRLTFSIGPNNPSLANLSIWCYPIWPNLACHASTSTSLEDIIKEEQALYISLRGM